ncbi:hypothetical protein GUITHDRAFT_112082 [Guillardia theta CCMP2712]|uniref:EF-hand domain-containing protein n=1 Tax=Guillardia theta (strain CCMP2712) TaxID=905079 RepID=L1J0C5_GUITC|nr:hypothetical protein GUITHDRAFT_112082 [Guillardia theta CCMP2712]EKX41946.1 hypothetical protein GUITHDRAFT_112082 [Guillardia theta CCMP2712]|eukprot:XP_005828926.1 hypothetical protein GUITHDRAFT_112082 [Guillardia theta CCMP2712]
MPEFIEMQNDSGMVIWDKPREEEIVMHGAVEKRIVSKRIYWSSRHVYLTDKYLMIALDDSSHIRDRIRLLDIFEVSRISSNEAVMFGGGSNLLRRHTGSSNSLTAMEASERDVSQLEWNHAFRILEHSSNRNVCLRASSEEECQRWIDKILQAKGQAVKDFERSRHLTRVERLRQKLSRSPIPSLLVNVTSFCLAALDLNRIYLSEACQGLLGAMLVVNFLFNAVDAELRSPPGTTERAMFDWVDDCFTMIYTCELIVNMFIHWFYPFFSSGWNIFDFIVILSSITTSVLLRFDTKSNFNISVLRLLRVFKIVRVFNKLRSLQKIVLAISISFVSVLNTLVLFLVVNSIYAIVGSSIFADLSPSQFGTFLKASFTMFQVATFDGWSTDVVRPLQNQGANSALVAIFFVSFLVLIGIVILNVIIAVILEGFLSAIDRFEQQDRISEESIEHYRVAGPLDPLLAILANFSSSSHLSSQIELVFSQLDIDGSGTLTFEELRDGLAGLNLQPVIQISLEDWDVITHNSSFCNDQGEMSRSAFEAAMRWQLSLYAQKLLAQRMQHSVKNHSDDSSILFAMKVLMLQDSRHSLQEEGQRSIGKREGTPASPYFGAWEHMERRPNVGEERRAQEDVGALITEGFNKVLAALERLERRGVLEGPDRVTSPMKKDETRSSVTLPSVAQRPTWTPPASEDDEDTAREKEEEEEEEEEEEQQQQQQQQQHGASEQEDADSSSGVSVSEEISLRLEAAEAGDVKSSVKRALLSPGDQYLRTNHYREAFEAYRSTLQLSLSREEWQSRIVTEEAANAPSPAHDPSKASSSSSARALPLGGQEHRVAMDGGGEGSSGVHKVESVPNLLQQSDLFMRSPQEEALLLARRADSEPIMTYTL